MTALQLCLTALVGAAGILLLFAGKDLIDRTVGLVLVIIGWPAFWVTVALMIF